jgi:hypothetical protein
MTSVPYDDDLKNASTDTRIPSQEILKGVFSTIIKFKISYK